MNRKKLVRFFDREAKNRDRWIRKNTFYYRQIVEFMKFHIPEGRSVLEIGCGTGFLLGALKPANGVGIDISPEMVRIARKNHPGIDFKAGHALDYTLKGKFDFIIISDTNGYFEDVQDVLKNLRQNCTHDTRVIITAYNYFWEPIVKATESLGMKMKQPFSNWLPVKDIEGLLRIEDFDPIKSGKIILMPKYIPLLSWFLNKYLVNFPFFRTLGLIEYVVARPINLEPKEEKSVSIVVAARNEEGNIEKIVKSLPDLGTKTEIIFIEGGSKDRTWEEILRVKKKYRMRDISCAKQDGKGKGDAVRKGFDMAKGDILMIYDADMTVPPKDLFKFYEAIVSNKGEFINGSRLVYPMDKRAMRTLNLLGNKMFSVIFSWLLNQRLKDTLCGTKVLTKKNYGYIKDNRHYFGEFDPFGDFDLIFGASKLDLKIVEVPIRYKERKYGDTNIQRFSHGWLLIKMCVYAMRRIKFV